MDDRYQNFILPNHKNSQNPTITGHEEIIIEFHISQENKISWSHITRIPSRNIGIEFLPFLANVRPSRNIGILSGSPSDQCQSFAPLSEATSIPVPCICKPHLPFPREMLTHLRLMPIILPPILLGAWRLELQENCNYQRKSNYVQVTCAERRYSLYFHPTCSSSVFVPLQLKFVHHIICACSHPLLLPVRSIFLFPPTFYLLCLSYPNFVLLCTASLRNWYCFPSFA